MDAASSVRENADQVLSSFFRGEQDPLGGIRLHRVLAAEADLRACFEECAPAYMSTADESVLAAERLFVRRGPAARIANPSVILEVLPTFLRESRWQGSSLQDRRVRSQLAWRLAQQIAHRLELRGSDEYEAVRAAVQRARGDIRRADAEAALHDLEARGVAVDLPPWVLQRLRGQGPG